MPLPPPTPASTPSPKVRTYPSLVVLADGIKDHGDSLTTPTSDISNCQSSKRRKTVSGLRLAPAPAKQIEPTEDDNNDLESTGTVAPKSVRQFHSDTRFPQRSKPGQGISPPVLEPSSTDKLIAGIWRQVYSSVQLSYDFSVWSNTPIYGLF